MAQNTLYIIINSYNLQEYVNFQHVFFLIVSYISFFPWVWLFPLFRTKQQVSCCLLLFHKSASAENESVCLTRAMSFINLLDHFWERKKIRFLTWHISSKTFLINNPSLSNYNLSFDNLTWTFSIGNPPIFLEEVKILFW